MGGLLHQCVPEHEGPRTPIERAGDDLGVDECVEGHLDIGRGEPGD